MATIKELIDKHGLPIKLKHVAWEKQYLEARYIHDDCLYGHLNTGEAFALTVISPSFELYTEPKKKKKLYLWAYYTGLCTHWEVTSHFYESEDSVKCEFKSEKEIRLDHTMIEVTDE